MSFSSSFFRRSHGTKSEKDSRGGGGGGGPISSMSTSTATDERNNHNHNLQFVSEKAGNTSGTTYQEATGAPVEHSSPLGYGVGAMTAFFLNVGKLIGTGVYSTPSNVLAGTGSPGLSLLFWFLGFLIAAANLAVYLEYLSYFPNRSGCEVVYLEQAYPRPRYLFPTAFAFFTVVLSFSSSNAIVLSEYIFAMSTREPSDWEVKGVAVAGYTVAVLLVIFHNRLSFWVSNGISVIKVITLVFITITGWVVLAGGVPNTSWPPLANFQNSFEGKATPYGLTHALVSIIFSYAGYENAFNMANEVKNPVKTIRKSSYASLLLVAVLFIFANIAYLAAVPASELETSERIAASLFFARVFGSQRAARGLNILIAISAFGNLVSVLIGTSRMIRECGRQGVLPKPHLWASTWPFGTPLLPYLVKWAVTVIMILAPPAGDAFNFVVDLQSYPNALFNFTLSLGIYLVRYRRRKLPQDILEQQTEKFRAWHPVIIFNLLVNLYLLVMPWVPPETGPLGGNVGFWYGTYAVTGIGIILGCVAYYFIWIYVLPRLGHYHIRQTVIVLKDKNTGVVVQTHKIIKVPDDEIEVWDASHDAVGRELDAGGVVGSTPVTTFAGDDGGPTTTPMVEEEVTDASSTVVIPSKV